MSTPVFVFGSNLFGIHGSGAALHAYKEKGAMWGKGEGHFGDSYALPTKVSPRVFMPLERVAYHVNNFKRYARSRPELTFQVTAVGTGLAGHKIKDIGPLFADAPDNCILCDEFKPYKQ